MEVVKTVNFMRARGMNHYLESLLHVEGLSHGLQYHTEV